jgi:hypothetical protein
MRAEGVLSVEMEAAALLAMGRALRRPVTCLAHVTNAMATRPENFAKGGHDGQEEALEVCARALTAAAVGNPSTHHWAGARAKAAVERPRDRRDLRDGLHRPDLVVRVHEADEDGVRRQRLAHVFGVHAPVLVDG